ncbi:hypothetical protein Tco_0114444 [Tanacetum coccineum]
MLGAVEVQILENNLDDLHSSREEDGTSESLGASDFKSVSFLRGTSVVVVILVKGHAFSTTPNVSQYL